MVWNPVDWSKAFRAAAAEGDGESLRGLRREVFESTVDAVRAQGYEVESERIDLDGSYAPLHGGTVFYAETEGLAVEHELCSGRRTPAEDSPPATAKHRPWAAAREYAAHSGSPLIRDKRSRAVSRQV